MFQIGKEYHFSASHTIPWHPKCGRMHGHNYKVLVKLTADELDDRQMVIDFGEIDKYVKPTIEAMDHKYLAFIEDPRAVELHISEVFHLPDKASTAECIAHYLYNIVHEGVRFMGLEVEVTVWETPKAFATYLRREVNSTATHGS